MGASERCIASDHPPSLYPLGFAYRINEITGSQEKNPIIHPWNPSGHTMSELYRTLWSNNCSACAIIRSAQGLPSEKTPLLSCVGENEQK